MKKGLSKLFKDIVCIWDEGARKLLWTNYEIPKCGIYSIRIGEDFYIGKSIDLKSRIQNHLNAILNGGGLGCQKVCKRFEELRQLAVYFVEEAVPEELDRCERFYLLGYEPTLNTQLIKSNENFQKITTSISEKNITRLSFAKASGIGDIQFSSKGEIISAILDQFFEENGEPIGFTWPLPG